MADPYVYEGTDVLKNLGGLKKQDDLDEFESAMFKLAFINMKDSFEIKNTDDIFKIHRIVFSEVYEWAGQPRIINIYKSEQVLDGLSVRYSDYSEIKKEIKHLNTEFKKVKISKDNRNIINEIVLVISKLWRVHAFREGNTRTIGLFLYFWMKKLNLKLNNNFLGENAKFFRNALVLASIDEYSEYGHLEKILNDAINDEDSNVLKDKYKTINGFDLDKYEYNYHHIKE